MSILYPPESQIEAKDTIPSEKFVTITFYEILDREVKSLVSEQIQTGSHNIILNDCKFSMRSLFL
jgi:hypothetical protein